MSSPRALKEPLLAKDGASASAGHSRVILAKLRPAGLVAIDGLTSEYAETYSAPLQKLMSEADFRAAIGAINQTCSDYFPCVTCVVYGYLGAALTCGLLFCCAKPCTGEVEENVEVILERINAKEAFRENGIEWELKRTRCHSWIEITQCPQARRKSHRHSI
ncbi:hypothetical protein ACHHYP_08085 [Achlya hypogyna]|uniref:Golgin subfamily A member 7/ERF4 domain-containing protein n=1 Tax=Achlya hypogyna TaxID=1202772 RepID=A0A1V9YQ07_ACHHY|nr:hypothetical protein ACHHYP_08085 [Achlya hypogyna]